MSAIHYKRAMLGAMLLAALAAAVNAHFMITAGISVSHLTGDLSRIGIDVAKADPGLGTEIVNLLTVLACFILGAAISGYSMQRPNLDTHHPYGRGVMAVGLLLIISALLQPAIPVAGLAMAAVACGMQNAFASRFRGLILRTTHTTGILTDLGQMLGMKIRGHRVENWKIEIQGLVALAFAAGAIGGALLDLGLPSLALPLLGTIYILAGLLWYNYINTAPDMT